MSDERGIERAEDFQRQQDELRIARIRANLDGLGEVFCRDCGDPIEEERRHALPSATRCFPCQNIHERQRRGIR